MGYKVYCRECDWSIPEPVELKGEANWLAGRHISDTGHSVGLKEVAADEDEAADPDAEFTRGSAEVLAPAVGGATEGT